MEMKSSPNSGSQRFKRFQNSAVEDIPIPQRMNTGRNDFSRQVFESLPDTAKQYYTEKTDRTTAELVYQLSTCQKTCNYLNLLRIYPLFSLKYLNSIEFCCAIVNGEHRIYQGPGWYFVTGITDRIVRKSTIGEDIDFGPIKVIYVKPGALKFACYRHTGQPLLLGPGMHYFNDLNLQVGREINMNFSGDNHSVPCDDGRAFQFVFVKTGSEAIVISGDGHLTTLGPGLHFIQAPDALKTFVSVQQEHFKFGTCDKNQCFLTADNIELHINATVFYRLTDVQTMFSTRIKDDKDLYETIHSQAMATLLTIIRSEPFQRIGNKQQISQMNRELQKRFDGKVDEEDGLLLPVAVPSAPLANSSDVLQSLTMGFQGIIHDAEPQFLRMMKLNFDSSGIEIQSLRIEQIEFADKTLQNQVSEFAMTNTKLQSQQQAIEAQKALQVAEAERDGATLRIKSKADADTRILLMEAENEVKIKTARADAENRIILAEAEAKAKLTIGEAELSIMERQNAMPNAQLRIVTDAQKEVMSGITKIIYTDQQSMLLRPYLQMPDV